MKKFISIALVLVLVFSFSACGSKDGGADKKETQKGVDEIVTDVQTTETKAVTPVELNTPITTDFVEITFDEVGVKENIKTSIKKGNITYTTGPTPEDGKKFMYIHGTMKNVSKSPLQTFNWFTGNFSIDDYNYPTPSCTIIDGNGKSLTSLDPLVTATFKIYIALPNELADSYSSAKFLFGFNKNFESVVIVHSSNEDESTSISKCEYQYSLQIK